MLFNLPLGGVGLEPDGAEVVPCGKADISVEGRRKLTEQRDGGLGAAFLNALDLVIGHACAACQVGNGQAEGGSDVIHGLPKGQRLSDRDPLGIVGELLGARPAGVVADHHTCLS
jgi:hypothetical protein